MYYDSFDCQIQSEEVYTEQPETQEVMLEYILLANRGQYVESVPGVQRFLESIGIDKVPEQDI